MADADEAIRLEPTLTEAYLVRSKCWGRKQDFDRQLEDASAGCPAESSVAIRLPHSRDRLVGYGQLQSCPRRLR